MTRGRSPYPQGEDDADDNDLYSYFNKSISAVQAHADYFEEDYARPALRTSQAFFDERPIAATFIATFSLLSFFPIVSFVGFSIFAVASFMIIALTCAFLASITVVLAFLSILVLFLLITLLSSLFLTSSVVFIYTAVRFLVLVRAHGRAGLSEWIIETQTRLLNVLPIASPRLDGYETSDYDALGDFDTESKHEDSTSRFLELEPEPEPEAKPEPEIKQENPFGDEETKVME